MLISKICYIFVAHLVFEVCMCWFPIT